MPLLFPVTVCASSSTYCVATKKDVFSEGIYVENGMLLLFDKKFHT